MKNRYCQIFLDKCKEFEDRFKKFDLDYYDNDLIKNIIRFFQKKQKKMEDMFCLILIFLYLNLLNKDIQCILILVFYYLLGIFFFILYMELVCKIIVVNVF